GAVVNIVRPNWNLREIIGTNLNISHQGFLIHRDGQFFYRHASQTYRRVVEEPMLEYLARFRGHATVRGINLLEVLRAP
ncbi:MAG: DUF1460 domain-containing protein, partial [Bdellovibrionaceae bacterium]|nr:DUF1460 domain-containing protein [Pseudobdellovibrionaceae bacterium]